MSPVIFTSAQLTNRAGEPTRGSVAVQQLLIAPARRDGMFVARLHAADDGRFLKEIPLWAANAGEAVELSIEFEVSKMHPRDSK